MISRIGTVIPSDFPGSPKQVAANRANAQKSTGPRTPEGKARSALNALTHGLTAITPVLPDEDPTTYEALRQRLFEQYRPVLALEAELVEALANTLWRLRRVGPMEAGILQRPHWEEQLSAAREAVRQVSPMRDAISQSLQSIAADLGDLPPDKEQAAEAQLEAVKAKERASLDMSAAGFIQDALGANLLDKLTRHETRLFRKVTLLLRELEHLQGQRVEAETVAEEAEEEEWAGGAGDDPPGQ